MSHERCSVCGTWGKKTRDCCGENIASGTAKGSEGTRKPQSWFLKTIGLKLVAFNQKPDGNSIEVVEHSALVEARAEIESLQDRTKELETEKENYRLMLAKLITTADKGGFIILSTYGDVMQEARICLGVKK